MNFANQKPRLQHVGIAQGGKDASQQPHGLKLPIKNGVARVLADNHLPPAMFAGTTNVRTPCDHCDGFLVTGQEAFGGESAVAPILVVSLLQIRRVAFRFPEFFHRLRLRTASPGGRVDPGFLRACFARASRRTSWAGVASTLAASACRHKWSARAAFSRAVKRSSSRESVVETGIG